MSFEERVELISEQAGSDLTGQQFHAVKVNASAQVVPVTAITDVAIGILQDTTSVTGAAVPVAVGGTAKALAGATIAAGAVVAPKADGTMQTAATTQTPIGMARTAAVSGDVFPVLIGANVAIKA